MRSKSFDLMAAILIAILNVGWTLIPNHPVLISIIFALPLIFFLPGYMLTQLLFRKRQDVNDGRGNLIRQPRLNLGHPIGPADHLILALGLSMAIDVVLGFTLNVFAIGLQALSWSLSLGLVTTILALVVMLMRKKEQTRARGISRPRLKRYEYFLFGLAILLATIAVWSSTVRPLAKTPVSFTQLWILPAQNHSCGIRIGIQSFESTPLTYRIVLTANNAQVQIWPSITLAPGTDWAQSVSIQPGAAQDVYIEARLYLASSLRSAYRNVHLTLHALKANNNTQQCSIGT